MRQRRGFTIVEIVVVMVIMAILLGLGFVVMVRSQANARDAKRDADTQVIARGLELRYKQGNTVINPQTNYAVGPGTYPGNVEIFNLIGFDTSGNGITGPSSDIGYGPSVLPGTALANFSPPGVTGGNYTGFTIRCLGQTNCAAEDMTAIDPMVTKDVYLYEPINADNSVCGGDTSYPCVRFNLYWRDEVTGTLHTIRSKHQ